MRFQEEVRKYEERVRAYEEDMEAWERRNRKEEAIYLAAYQHYGDEMREHITRTATFEMTNPTEQTSMTATPGSSIGATAGATE
eukprot:12131904-Heterocapsa_arctica.AAC.1